MQNNIFLSVIASGMTLTTQNLQIEKKMLKEPNTFQIFRIYCKFGRQITACYDPSFIKEIVQIWKKNQQDICYLALSV